MLIHREGELGEIESRGSRVAASRQFVKQVVDESLTRSGDPNPNSLCDIQ